MLTFDLEKLTVLSYSKQSVSVNFPNKKITTVVLIKIKIIIVTTLLASYWTNVYILTTQQGNYDYI